MPKKPALRSILPCKNCLLLVMRKYRGYDRKVDDSDNYLIVHAGEKLIAKEPIAKMDIGCRFCKGMYLHQVGELDAQLKNQRRG